MSRHDEQHNLKETKSYPASPFTDKNGCAGDVPTRKTAVLRSTFPCAKILSESSCRTVPCRSCRVSNCVGELDLHSQTKAFEPILSSLFGQKITAYANTDKPLKTVGVQAFCVRYQLDPPPQILVGTYPAQGVFLRQGLLPEGRRRLFAAPVALATKACPRAFAGGRQN